MQFCDDKQWSHFGTKLIIWCSPSWLTFSLLPTSLDLKLTFKNVSLLSFFSLTRFCFLFPIMTWSVTKVTPPNLFPWSQFALVNWCYSSVGLWKPWCQGNCGSLKTMSQRQAHQHHNGIFYGSIGNYIKKWLQRIIICIFTVSTGRNRRGELLFVICFWVHGGGFVVVINLPQPQIQAVRENRNVYSGTHWHLARIHQGHKTTYMKMHFSVKHNYPSGSEICNAQRLLKHIPESLRHLLYHSVKYIFLDCKNNWSCRFLFVSRYNTIQVKGSLQWFE